jgi:hypothetical protein
MKKFLNTLEREGKQSNKVPVRTPKNNCLTTPIYRKESRYINFALKPIGN